MRIVGTLERSFYVWISSALFIAVCALWQPIAGIAWRFDQPAASWFMRAVQFLGVWITLRSALLIGIGELSGVRQLTEHHDTRQTYSGALPFITRGPYRWVRHPIYTGWFLMVFAEPVMTMTRLVFALTSCFYLVVAIPFEERSLRVTSNGAYDRYMRTVPWKLVPRLY